MNKVMILGLTMTFLTSSCSSYMEGTVAGSSLGSVLGSAIGGIAGGARGSNIGTIVGMIGGAAVGAAIDEKVHKKEQEEIHEHYECIQKDRVQDINCCKGDYPRKAGYLESKQDDAIVFDATHSGDDRIDFQPSETIEIKQKEIETKKKLNHSVSEQLAGQSHENTAVEISNVIFTDANNDGALSKGERGEVTFEIHNRGTQPISNLTPSITEVSDREHFKISPAAVIERLMPNETVRYTASIVANKKIRAGKSTFALSILLNNKSISKVLNFKVNTLK